MKYQITYTTPDNQEKVETFSSIPDGAYAALGICTDTNTRPGDLFVARLARGGTSLIPLINLRGKQARTNPKHAGLNKQGTQWLPQ